MKQNCCEFLLNGVWVLLSQHTTFTMCCVMKNKCKMSQKSLNVNVLLMHTIQVRWKIARCMCSNCLLSEMLSHLWFYKEAFGYSQTCSDHAAMTKADWLWKGTWLQNHVSKWEVARRLGVSHSVIWRLNQLFLATGRVEERCRSGRTKKTTHCENHFIQREALQIRPPAMGQIVPLPCGHLVDRKG